MWWYFLRSCFGDSHFCREDICDMFFLIEVHQTSSAFDVNATCATSTPDLMSTKSCAHRMHTSRLNVKGGWTVASLWWGGASKQTTNQLGMGQNPGIHNYVCLELSIGVQSCLTHTQLAQRTDLSTFRASSCACATLVSYLHVLFSTTCLSGELDDAARTNVVEGQGMRILQDVTWLCATGQVVNSAHSNTTYNMCIWYYIYII